MIRVKRDFTDRVDEINLYFAFLENVMVNGGEMVLDDASTEAFTPDLNKILRVNCFLLLYNLSESCIKNAVEVIYQTLDREGVSYDDLKEGFKVEIIKFLKTNINAKDFATSISEISRQIILKCFNSEQLISGNLDAREVKKLATKYGFSPRIAPMTKPDGSIQPIDTNNLLVVKSQRNNLAHGIYSFKECGRDYTIQDLILIKTEVIEYLRQILDNIESYITARDYLVTAIP